MYKIQPKTLFLGRNVVYLTSCHSTNDSALEIIQNEPPPEGTIVITDNQIAGRGQRGTTWEATSHQNLTFSLILYPTFLQAHQQFKLNQAISLGINAFLRKKGIKNALIKWPNDIYVGEKKIGGVLIENSLFGANIKTSIIGIGLNINQLSFDNPRASSLALTLGQPALSLENCLSEIMEEIEPFYDMLADMSRWQLIQQLYESYLLGIHQQRLFVDSVGNGFQGIIRGVHPSGLLQIEKQDKMLSSFDLKQVSFVFENEDNE